LFNPPPFAGLPFSQAAILQNRSLILQKIAGFIPGQAYKLTFCLGSRYRKGTSNGNQIVVATLDNNPIGVWRLTDATPFTLMTAAIQVASRETHILAFEGAVQGTTTTSSTAFLVGSEH
jgi:hypothetical protein